MSAQVPRTVSTQPKRGLLGMGRGRTIALIVGLLVVVAVGYSVYSRMGPASATPVATVPVTRGTVAATVSASGTVVNTRQAKLSFGTGGKLKTLAVNIGDSVKAGQVLATVDSTALEIKLEQAKSNLRIAETKLQQLKAGSPEADVAAAQAAYESAVAKYNDLAAGASVADLKAAEQAVISAEANVQKGESDLAALGSGLSADEVIVAKADLERREAALKKAQGDYDRVASRADVAARPEALALQQATIDYQSALASYNLKVAGAKPEDVAVAQKSVESARAALASAQEKLAELKAGPKSAELEAARSSVASARAALVNKTGGPMPEELVLQEEQVKQAQISLRQAEYDLANAQIAAPFDGTVAALGVNVGEQVGAGTAAVTLVDVAAFRIDATVDESDVARIVAGKTAQVTFDALPNERFEGRVTAVAPTATVQQGVVTYLVTVQIDRRSFTIPSGLSANVVVEVDRKDGVLTLPNRAIRSQARARIVEVQTPDGKTEVRQVRVGLSGDQTSEILEGVGEGENVVLPSSSAISPVRTGIGNPSVQVKPASGAPPAGR